MWSKTEKKLESLLCDSLKGRVQYFVTSYTDAGDQYGRACFVVDGKEMFNMCFYRFQVETWKIEQSLLNNPDYKPKFESKYSASLESKDLARERGIYGDEDFFNGMLIYLRSPIRTSLRSENPITQSFALIDRRIGKRTLMKLHDEMTNQKDIVKYFYTLRCQAEGIL